MILDERKLKILQAIIGDFITNAEPVGSRTLSKKYKLGISPATIRNEMSDLEEMGLLTHPHTSAGRVPSDKAYRLYVNEIMRKREIPDNLKAAISEKLLVKMNELDTALEETARILSEITKLTSFAVTPNKAQDKLKYVNITPFNENSIIFTIVSESGKTSSQIVKIDSTYTEEGLIILAKILTYNFKGKTISQALTMDILESLKAEAAAMEGLATSIMPGFMRTLEDMLNVNLYMEGLSNIFDLPEYNDIEKAKMFMNTMSKKEILAKNISTREDGIIITIGNENPDENFKDYSLITATYHIDGKMVGKLGVIGPTRMRYEEITSIIEYLTDNLTNAFSITGGSYEQRKD